MSQARTPADFLKNIKGKPVVVKLNSGVDYRGARQGTPISTCKARSGCLRRPSAPASAPVCLHAGILACLDGYMNIAMEQTEVRGHYLHCAARPGRSLLCWPCRRAACWAPPLFGGAASYLAHCCP